MKSKKEIIENPSGFKAVNAFIFAGSFSLGTMKAGFDLEKVLEISQTQLEENAFFFTKNVSDVPVVLPDEWENEEYFQELKKEDIDLMCCNCPCSSLSKINRNASVDGKNNVHFYRLFKLFKGAQPKVFVIENAPTLIQLGFKILKDMVSELEPLYKFTVIRDFAGNHEVAMARQRTLVVGWRRDFFNDEVPVVEEDAHKQKTVGDVLNDIINDTTNDLPSAEVDDISDLYKHAVPGEALLKGIASKCIKDPAFDAMIMKRLASSKHLREVARLKTKIKSDGSAWDKTPFKLELDGRFPSLTSVNEYLHPVQDRTLSLKEVARIMNYPDWYDFHDPDKKCKIPVTQAIAQGVPANFGKYIAMQARKALEKKLKTLSTLDTTVVFQHHSAHKLSEFTSAEFMALSGLDLKPNAVKI